MLDWDLCEKCLWEDDDVKILLGKWDSIKIVDSEGCERREMHD